MRNHELAAYFENRIYDMDVHYGDVKNLCYEAIDWKFASVQVFPAMLWLCDPLLKKSGVDLCAMLSYPHGGMTMGQKVCEAKDAAAKGATHLMVVANGRKIVSDHFDYVYEEMRQIKQACPDQFVKVLIEAENLDQKRMERLCETALKAGIDGIVTSTGLYNTVDRNQNDVPIKVTTEEIRIIKNVVGNELQVQAQGNIATLVHAVELLEAGADRLGSKYAAQICEEHKKRGIS